MGLYQAGLGCDRVTLSVLQAIALLIPAFFLIGWAANVTVLSAGLLLYSFGELSHMHCKPGTKKFALCLITSLKRMRLNFKLQWKKLIFLFAKCGIVSGVVFSDAVCITGFCHGDIWEHLQSFCCCLTGEHSKVFQSPLSRPRSKIITKELKKRRQRACLCFTVAVF